MSPPLALQVDGKLVPWTPAHQSADDGPLLLMPAMPPHDPPGHFSVPRPHKEPPDPAELKPFLPQDKPPAQEDPAELKPVLPYDKPPAMEDSAEHQGSDKYQNRRNLTHARAHTYVGVVSVLPPSIWWPFHPQLM